MPYLHRALALLLVVLPLISVVRSEDQVPQDVFYLAHNILKKAEAAEKEQRFNDAYELYLESSDLFDSLARKWPAWNPGMLKYRRSLIRKDIQRVATMRHQIVANRREPDLPQRNFAGSAPQDATRPNAVGRPPVTGSVEERYRRLQNDVNTLQRERQSLLSQLDEKRSGQLKAQRDLATAQREVLSLQSALTQSQSELQAIKKASGVESLKNQVEELKGQLAQATDSLRQANERTEKLLIDLEEANALIAQMKQREELLIQQRDEMVELVRGLKMDESTGGLVTENMRLREQLNATRAKVDDLQFEKDQDTQTIKELRQEISTLRSDLANVQRENEAYKQRLAELQGHLMETHNELEMNPPAFDDIHGREENEMLREIIRKQLRQQNHRREAKELYVQELELQQLQDGSDELLAKINELTAEAELTDEEKRLVMATELPEGGGVIRDGADLGVESEELKQKILAYAKAAAFDFKEGRFEKAEAYWADILEFAPNHLRTLCNLGVVKHRLNKLEEARGLYQQVLIHDPNHSFAHYMLGRTDFQLEEFDEALGPIAKAVELEPNNAEYQHFLGVIHMAKGDIAAAEESFRKAVELEPRFADAHYNLAVLYLKKDPQAWELARTHYESAVQNGVENQEMAKMLSAGPNQENAAAIRLTSQTPAS